MKRIPLSLVAAGLLLPVGVYAQPEGGGPEKRGPRQERPGGREGPPDGPGGGRGPRGEGFEKAWKKADADGDGKISRSEFDNMPRIQKLPAEKRDHIFSRLDKNQDGVLSEDEMKMGHARPGDAREAMMRFRELDTDGSGGISFEEMKAGELFKKLPEEKQKTLFARLDTDGDGQITVKDKPGPPDGRPGKMDKGGKGGKEDGPDKPERPDRPPRDARRMLRDFDTNGDGALSFDEFRNAPPNKELGEDEQEDRFEALDKNGDKKLDEADLPPRPERPERQDGPPPRPDGGGAKPSEPPPPAE